MSEWFAMGGHGLYIWGSYGVALLIFVFEVFLVRSQRKSILKRLRLMRDAGDSA